MRLIDVDELRKRIGIAEKCDDCKHFSEFVCGENVWHSCDFGEVGEHFCICICESDIVEER